MTATEFTVQTPSVRQHGDAVKRLVAEGRSRNEIAKELGLGTGTVSKIAKAVGASFDRGYMVVAAQMAAQMSYRERRTMLAGRLLDKTNDLLNDMDKPFLAFAFGGKDNVYSEHRLAKPPTADIRNLMTAAGTAMSRHLDLERHDSSAGADVAKSLLTTLGAALGLGQTDEGPTP